ncbi:hypothetical protein FRB93_008439 [Tulasnella sp. JGI-2019a]|nr:hypothetical protein FRB93_008439 [Tulasnella sp. JGI-2019a]
MNLGPTSAPETVPTFQCLSFNGDDSEDVTEFVREVNRIALAQGRQRDEEWIFDFAEACLGGVAIIWLDQFQGENGPITSWKALRHALLDRFGPFSASYVPQPALVPAIPPVSKFDTIIVPRLTGAPELLAIRRGRIRLVGPESYGVKFVTIIVLPDSCILGTTIMPTEASIFEFSIPESDAHVMHLELVDQLSPSPHGPIFLGLVNVAGGKYWYLQPCICPTIGLTESLIEPDMHFDASKDVWKMVGRELFLSLPVVGAQGEYRETGDCSLQIKTYSCPNAGTVFYAESLLTFESANTTLRFFFDSV